MEMVEFAVLSFCNLSLLFWIVKRQGMASVEGYCAAFLGMAALTDNLSLLFDYFVQPAVLPLGADEFYFRAYPTVVQIIALVVLMTGLFMGNPKPEPIRRECSARELEFVTYTGAGLVLVGLILTGFAIYFTEAYRAPNFYEALDSFRGSTPGREGGFWYHGSDIAMFGIALTVVGWGKTRGRLILLLLATMCVGLFLTSNKGTFERALLWTALALYVYNPRRFWSLFKPRVVLVCVVLSLLGVAAKRTLRGSDSEPFALKALGQHVEGTIGTRWGDQGIFRNYCQFVHMLPKYHYFFDGYAEGVDTLTSWVPRALNPKKRPQPSHGLGFMLYADAHTYSDENPAIGLVGSVYADNGFYTLTAYLLIVGFLLGVLRRYAAGRRSTLQWHVSYLMFALFGGLSAEAGITALAYTFILTFAFAGLAHLLVVGLFRRKQHGGIITVHPVARRGWSTVRSGFNARLNLSCNELRPNDLASDVGNGN